MKRWVCGLVVGLSLSAWAQEGALPPERSPGLSRSFDAVEIAAPLLHLLNFIAPHWDLAYSPLGPERVRLVLRRKGLVGGGDGEASRWFARGAERIAADRGFAGYTIVEYSEGIANGFPWAERVAEGVIQLSPAAPMPKRVP